MSNPVMVITPEPPTQGAKMRVCIDPGQPVTITLEYVDAPDEQHVSDASGCVEVTVPGAATSVTASASGAIAASTPINVA